MSLASGTRLGPYEILGLIGAGGMGEVYKARDSRLDRTVAIKVLPAELSADPERRARFEREARAVAALAHPNVCALFDIGESMPSSPESGGAERRDGRIPSPESRIPAQVPVHYLVMEHLAGQTLAERLARGALPLGEALELATQIADALDAAHRQGIIHRDLKPGNVMLVTGGTGRAGKPMAKLLDFGLARAFAPAGASATADGMNSSTLTDSLTVRGTVMGTLPYMAPELLEGKRADARSDLWALGTMIYEMLTGRRAFAGDSQASLIGCIMNAEPPALAEQQPLTPPALEHVVRKCLAKRPDDRWDSAHDVADELRWIAEEASGGQAAARGNQQAAPFPRRRAWLVHAAWAAACVVLLGLLGRQYFGTPDSPPPGRAAARPVVHMDVVVPADMPFWVDPEGYTPSLAVAPDGSSMAYTCARGATTQLCLREFNRSEVVPVAGTEGARFPVYSRDGRSIVFCAARANACEAGGPVRRLSVVDGRVDTLGVIPERLRCLLSIDWLDDNRLLLSGLGGPWTMPLSGGASAPLLRMNEAEGDEGFSFPVILPDGRRVIGTLSRTSPKLTHQVRAVSLDSGEQRVLLENVFRVWHVPTGHLLYYDWAHGSTMVAAFDDEDLSIGTPVAFWEPVRAFFTKPALAFSATSGALLYLPALADRMLTWVDRQRREVPAVQERGSWGSVTLHPDGRRAAVDVVPERGLPGIVVVDLNRGISTPAAASAVSPAWTRDGSKLTFVSMPLYDKILWQAADAGGVPELLRQGSEEAIGAWSHDGRLAYTTKNARVSRFEIGLLSRTPAGWESRRLLPPEGEESGHSYAAPRFSPDGRWLAYNSNESGRWEVYIRAYPGGGERTRVSGGGGYHPVWSRDGRELFYRNGSQFYAVRVSSASLLTLSTPQALFNGPYLDSGPLSPPDYDVSSDGQRFLVVRVSDEERAPRRFHLVQNWFEDVKAKVPAVPDAEERHDR